MNPLREDIRDSLVRAGQEACGYMNCKIFVQAVTGVPKLDELPSRPFRSIGDLTTGDVLKWGTGQHWAIYIGGGDIMEVEEWGAESRIVPLAEVLEEMDPPDMVFSTVVPQQEGLLREYIRRLLTEAAKGLQDLPPGVGVRIIEEYGIVSIWYEKLDNSKGDINGPSGGIHIVHTRGRSDLGPCGDAWKVSTVDATQGWGPLLYDIAMEYATLNGGGLIADRDSVSPKARRIWDYYLSSRSDVESHQLDDLKNTLTPDIEEDNCDQRVATYNVPFGYGEVPKNIDWVDSPLSKRYTKPPITIEKLRSLGKLVEL